MTFRSWWDSGAAHWQRTAVIVAVILGIAAYFVSGPYPDPQTGDAGSSSTEKSDGAAERGPGGQTGSAGAVPRVQPLDLTDAVRTESLGSLSDDWELGNAQVGGRTIENAITCDMDEFVAGTYPDASSSREYLIPDGAKRLSATVGVGDETDRPEAQVYLQVKDAISGRLLFQGSLGVGESQAVHVSVLGVVRVGFYVRIQNPAAPIDGSWVVISIGEASVRR